MKLRSARNRRDVFAMVATGLAIAALIAAGRWAERQQPRPIPPPPTYTATPRVIATPAIATPTPTSTPSIPQRIEAARVAAIDEEMAAWAEGRGAGREAILRSYYEPSPSEIAGWATRYGTNQNAVAELRWVANEAREQWYEHFYVLPGGGYGYHQLSDGQTYLFEGRHSPGYENLATGRLSGPQRMTPAQWRLFNLAAYQLSDEEYEQHIANTYAAVVSLASPNDIGREFCLYSTDGEYIDQIGPVIVGNTSAQGDWTPVAGRDDPLGAQSIVGQFGQAWHWVADLPDNVYAATNGRGGPAQVFLEEGIDNCPLVRSPYEYIPTFACPVTHPTDCADNLIYGFDLMEHPGVDLAGGGAWAPAPALVEWAGEGNGCGGTVMLNFGGDWYGRFCHFETILVETGAEVVPGQLLGTVGNSGDTRDGQHVHIEIIRHGQYYNLLDFLEE